MKTTRRFFLPFGTLLFLLSATFWAGLPHTRAARSSVAPLQSANLSASVRAAREDAYRANNIGVALLEQYKYKEGAEAFTRSLSIDPKLAIARINLSIALYNVPDVEASLREAKSAIVLDPNAPQPHYIIGLIARAQNRTDESIASFQRVLRIDPHDVGTNVNLGQLYAQQHRYPEAIAAFRTAMDAEPYNQTAVYNLAITLTRTGERAEGQRLIQRFQKLRQSGVGTTIGQNYLEQGRYAEAVASTGAEPELVDRSTPAVTFKDATASMLPASAANANRTAAAQHTPAAIFGRRFKASDFTEATKRDMAAALGGSVTLFDYDGDGDLDMFVVTPFEQRLYRNDGGKFVDVTAQSGALAEKFSGVGIAAVAGDYDNDGRPDLFVLRYGNLALYHNDGNGKFSDVTAQAGIPAYPYLSASVAFVDADHDGNLDIFIAGLADLSKAPSGGSDTTLTFPDDLAGAPNMLLRNNGNGRFTDITGPAKVRGELGHAVAVVPTDFDNRRDVDLLVVNYGKAPDLFSNQRDGSFRNVAREVGLDVKGNWTCVAAGDVNKDGYTDFFFGRIDGPGLWAMSDGKARFRTTPAPATTEGASAAQFLDYDNDGLLDLVANVNGGLRVWRNVGDGWVETTERAVERDLRGEPAPPGALSGRTLAAGDIDGDGDTDLVTGSQPSGLKIVRNDGGNRNRSLRVRLAGRISNRSGVQAKIEMRAGSLVQKLETYAASPAPAPADIIFGLGKHDVPDAVRVLWPAGIVQAETEIVKTQTASARTNDRKPHSSVIDLLITEIDRKPSSCPYLYAWNGERFEFVTDFMGAGEMGYWEAPGRFNTPQPEEYVRIRGDQLRARNGRYDLRVTNELEEALFVDRLQLIAIAHPQNVEVYPLAGMVDPPFPPFKIYATKGAHPPLSAVDDHGHDVLPRITKLDRWYPDNFRLDRIRGYAGEHTLTMKLDEGRPANTRTLLLLTGWTDYAWSSDNVAASHSGKSLSPPALQVKDARGRWRTVIENIGVPIGRPQTVTVDLTGKFLTSNREVRIVTNMRIYWDQILVDTSRGDFPTQMTRLDPTVADLHWRGFSRETTPDGREPFGYDYQQVSFTSPWKVLTGRYTREGDVRELLRRTDDMFVISRPGDEISLSFDATALPPLPVGWTRTFLLYADGFSKEMDINSASPDQLAPLPFHGMKSYPYAAPQAYPLTEARREYMERYNTRIVASPVSAIESVLLEASSPALSPHRGANSREEQK